MHHHKTKRDKQDQSEVGVFALLISAFMVLMFVLGATVSGVWS